ncbi:MAG: NAD(P)/FAD-dependent oxidoreductase [Nitrososphaera sp.]
MEKIAEIRVDFSLRREVFFVVIGAILGAISMIFPRTLFEVGMGLPYYLTWIAFGHIVGVYSSASVFAGIAIHMVTAVSIGIAIGLFLYKTGILNISKLSNGLTYGLFAGTTVFVVFFIPVYQFVLAPEISQTLAEAEPSMDQAEAAQLLAESLPLTMIGSIVMHLVFGLTLGLASSLLSIRFGSRYRCSKCNISFSRIDSYQRHTELVHGARPIELKRILILGGGFAGIEVLRRLQAAFQDNVRIDISLVSRDNFFLFTPMLPEVSSGMIETRHIMTPVRAFCKRARFYEANVESIDLKKRHVVITHAIGKEYEPVDSKSHTLCYDYLVLALGSETHFFGMSDVAKNAFTMKSIGDAIVLRNHVINMLEQADVEHEDKNLRERLMTFVVVGGGFSGVETVGELNDFIRDSIKHFYHNINSKDARIILVNSGGRILPEVTEGLAEFALDKLRENGIEVMMNTRMVGLTAVSAKLNNGIEVACHTVIWAGGGRPEPMIADLYCEHDKTGRIMTNSYLEVEGHDGVYALGDSASATDPSTGMPYPPTAQHAIRQGKVAAINIISGIKGDRSKLLFDYKTKGMMALIGKRNGVAMLMGHNVQGFPAWAIWRSYYLSNLPTVQKKLRVLVDWLVDLFFKRDVTRLRMTTEGRIKRSSAEKPDSRLSQGRGVNESKG